MNGRFWPIAACGSRKLMRLFGDRCGEAHWPLGPRWPPV